MRQLSFLLALCLALCCPLPVIAAKKTKTVYHRVNTEEKIVAITFDDGPHPKYTEMILDILAKYDAKATFFVIGKNLEQYGRITRRAAEEGHEIGNHTYTHAALSPLDRAQLEREILDSEGLIAECIGKSPTLFRPPGGGTSLLVEQIVSGGGDKIILWDVDTRDWAGRKSADIVKTVMENTVPGSIILFHDYAVHESATVEALKEILPRLSAAGYRFVTVTELLSYAVTAGGGD